MRAFLPGFGTDAYVTSAAEMLSFSSSSERSPEASCGFETASVVSFAFVILPSAIVDALTELSARAALVTEFGARTFAVRHCL